MWCTTNFQISLRSVVLVCTYVLTCFILTSQQHESRSLGPVSVIINMLLCEGGKQKNSIVTLVLLLDQNIILFELLIRVAMLQSVNEYRYMSQVTLRG